MKAKTENALELTKKLFERGGYDRTAKMCRSMIDKLVNDPEEADAVVEFRALLVDSMIEGRKDDDPFEPIIEEVGLVFTGYLSLRNRAAAASTLMETARTLEVIDRSTAFEIGFKIVDLFSSSTDSKLTEVVKEAYAFLFTELSVEDERFLGFCTQYSRFLQRPSIDAGEAVSTILNIDEILDGDQNAMAVDILQSFLLARSGVLPEKQLHYIWARLASNYLVLKRYEDAIDICTKLLVHGGDESRLDYTLWCGEAFMNLGRDETAAMFFQEVVRALRDTPEDERRIQASKLLYEVSSVESIGQPEPSLPIEASKI